jgi:hypothetical protein
MMHKLLLHATCRNIFMILVTWAIVAVFPALSMGDSNHLSFRHSSDFHKRHSGNTIDRRLIAGDHHLGVFSHEEQGRFKRNYNEWKSLSPENRKELRHRMDHWRELSPGERELYQKRYHQFQQLPPDERGRVREKLDRWDNLSPQEQDEIRRSFPTH